MSNVTDTDSPHCTVLHKSINRPNTIMGADRELFLLLATICAALAFGAMTKYTIVIAAILWVVGLAVIRMATKADPFFKLVGQRHTKYRSAYPARSNYQRVGQTTTPAWK